MPLLGGVAMKNCWIRTRTIIAGKMLYAFGWPSYFLLFFVIFLKFLPSTANAALNKNEDFLEIIKNATDRLKDLFENYNSKIRPPGMEPKGKLGGFSPRTLVELSRTI